jgi:hypothetical protein
MCYLYRFAQISHPLFYINWGLHVSSKSLLGSYNDQYHPWAAKISKQYLLYTKLENQLFWWGWKMATGTSKNHWHVLFARNSSIVNE